jgi:hypothetical protein
MPVAGGDALQVTHETTGAFSPAWAPDGVSILYGTSAGSRIFIVVPGGTPRVFAEVAQGVGDPTCNETSCLAVTNPYTTGGELLLIPSGGGATRVVDRPYGRARHPAFLHASTATLGVTK